MKIIQATKEAFPFMFKEKKEKTAEELYEQHYKGFTSWSVKEAHKKGFLHGVKVARNERK